ncbi:MAG: isochorismate synthase, partial [Cyanobacteria bacterium J06641_5]
MTAIFCPPPLQQDRSQLQAFLASCQQRSRGHRRRFIASFSLPLGAIDPLAALQALATPQSRYFYWEHPIRREAEAALDVALELSSPEDNRNKNGGSRFTRAQQFVKDAMVRLHCDPISGAAARVRFYHCFSFFETSAHFPSASIVLPRWQISRRQGRSWLTANLPIDPNDNLETLWASVIAFLDALAELPASAISLVNPPQFAQGGLASFTTAVVAALQAIEARSLQKVVLAHSLEARAAEPFDPARALAYLRQHHPRCYTFAVGTGSGQTFVGASPERLIALQGRQVVCDALAGSVRRGRTAAEDTALAGQLLASNKERREHQAVRGFLCDRLQQLGLQPQVTGTRLLQLANIQHLWTPIRAEVPEGLHLLDLVAWLHPTPAVAGLPANTACDYIRHWEPFDRGPYAAPIGWLDTQGNGEFVVGIRSALLDGTRARLYAGAGIVAGSTPERECAEVELKLQAMLK